MFTKAKAKAKDKVQSGFTIIEVMIVLAIAGLILVVVLIAIPQLQRNQRNENRRSVASRIVTEINNFAGNNNGDYPEAVVTGPTSTKLGWPSAVTGFFNRYLGCSNTTTECEVNINDPQTGFPVGSGDNGMTASINTSGTEPGSNAGDLLYRVGAICDGEGATDVGANARNFVFSIRLEGGAIYCLDNQ